MLQNDSNPRFARLLALICLAILLSTAPCWAQQQETEKAPQPAAARTLGIVLYDGFELLDVYGPAEMFGNVGKALDVVMIAEKAGEVTSAQGPVTVAKYGFDDCPQLDIVLVPGGIGTLRELRNETMLNWLRNRAGEAEIVSSVCSGSAILAKAGLLDGYRATSNKVYFSLAENNGPDVEWVKEARWVEDRDRVTSSGVSAGIDMSLAIISRLYGEAAAEAIANGTEYTWHRDADVDPFAKFAK